MSICILGSVYLFITSDNGTTWTFQQKVTAPDGAASDYFGVSVSMNGDMLAVGADFDDVNGLTNSGRRNNDE